MADPLSSLQGAVDLSGLVPQQQPDSAQGAGGAAGGAAAHVIEGAWIVALSTQNLQQVLVTSTQVPVIVVFTSKASPNSATLDDLLQRHVRQAAGRLQLAQVDVDAQPQVAQAFRVNAVPAAAAVIQGQPVPLFQGLPDESQVTTMLAQVMDAAARAGMTAVLAGTDADRAGESPADQAPQLPEWEAKGEAAVSRGDFDVALEIYDQEIKKNPANSEAQTRRAQVKLMAKAAALNSTPEAARQQTASDPDDPDAANDAADAKVLAGDIPGAFSDLIAFIAAHQDDVRDTARVHLLELFDAVGSSDPAVKKARMALASALFS
ncbi:MAG: tetratricopeptide repeat protein [Actinomycetaceae bacterium]|nr:tetratricopeptide repeat protein [Actinomycetaceae bacterium]MDY6082780.1 tetratricopeptide repeat protein [Actinomycetaceae bacterium]